MKVMRQSHLTGETNVREVNITIEQYIAWQDADDLDENRFVQNAFPHLSADDREFLISGVTAEEWDNAFGEDIEAGEEEAREFNEWVEQIEG